MVLISPLLLRQADTAMRTEWSCPVCQDTRRDVNSALPCHHQFCLGYILWWAKRNPACPLCRRIEAVRFSKQDEQDYIQFATISPKQLLESSRERSWPPCRKQPPSPCEAGLLWLAHREHFPQLSRVL